VPQAQEIASNNDVRRLFGGESKLRILTFTHLFPNAEQPVWGVFVYQRVAHLAQRPGNEVTVVAPVPYIPKWFPTKSWDKYKGIPKEEIVGGLSVIHPRYPHVPRIAMPLHGFLLFLGCYRCVARIRREKRFECIDSHWIYPDGFAAVLLGKTLRVPVFCSARGTDINVYPTFRWIRPLIRWSLGRAAGIIAVSQSLKQLIVGLGIPENKICVIGNGVDLTRFEPMDRREARSKLGLPIEAQIVVSVGSLNEHKSHDRLILAFKEIAPRWPELRLYILGEGQLRGALEKLASDNGLHGRIFLPGTQANEDLKWWYNAADLTCLSSTREGWPNVLLESLACGTPVVATKVGGVPEVIMSPEHGILVEPDAAALARGLESALTQKWNREAIVTYTRSRTWNEVAREVEAVLKAGCCHRSE
jgi:teichuronic acid biosynthesis glycosyltransferase TuaC